ncbi:MAG: DUF748 domain-containing protein [Crocinitomicaceae bacterium]|nr:DUF748 domain-containing protein [Crocinitomicaceae bacterium]
MKTYLSKFFSWFKALKLVFKLILILLSLICILLFFTNTIAKAYINSNGEELSGRKLHLSDINLNFFTTSVSLGDFVMYEANKTDTFMYLGNAYANLSPWGLMSDEIRLTQIDVDRLKLEIIQHDSTFNFSDLGSDEPEDTTAAPTKFYLYNVNFTNSAVRFHDRTVSNTYPIHNLNISIPEYTWNSETSGGKVDFQLGKRGYIAIEAYLNNLNNEYEVDVLTKRIDLNYVEVYLKQLFNINSLTGELHADLNLKGDLDTPYGLLAKGNTAISKLNIIDKMGSPFTSIDSVGVIIDSMNIEQFYFDLSETLLEKPVLYATLNHDNTNIDYVLEPLMGNENPADTNNVSNSDTTVVEETPFHFEIGTTTIQNGLIHYNDNTLDREFHYTISDLNLTTKNISEASRDLVSDFSMRLGNKGYIEGTSTFDLVETENIAFKSVIKDLDLLPFSPYSEYYIASPITQGAFNYNIDIEMTALEMINNNNFDIRELEFGKKLKTSDSAYKVPIKLAMVLLKDKYDNIQFDIPVTGNPSDPDFKLFPIVWKTFTKFIAKAASKPMSAVSSIAGNNPEDLERMKFDYGQKSLNEKQKETLNQIIEICQKKPALFFSFSQMTHVEEEKEFIAIQEAKKLFNPSDWQDIDDKNTEFNQYLLTNSGLPEGTSVNDMATKIIGPAALDTKLETLISSRNNSISDYFTSKELNPESYTVGTAHLKNLPEELKKPQFKIEVSVN